MAAWTVLISDGNVSAGPAGPFFSLIVLNEHSVTARHPQLKFIHGIGIGLQRPLTATLRRDQATYRRLICSGAEGGTATASRC